MHCEFAETSASGEAKLRVSSGKTHKRRPARKKWQRRDEAKLARMRLLSVRVRASNRQPCAKLVSKGRGGAQRRLGEQKASGLGSAATYLPFVDRAAIIPYSCFLSFPSPCNPPSLRSFAFRAFLFASLALWLFGSGKATPVTSRHLTSDHLFAFRLLLLLLLSLVFFILFAFFSLCSYVKHGNILARK